MDNTTEKKLQVKNLVISFRTVSGKVQAVRDISFDLNRGETLAIVGESGSGKSVTSKAILGILAGNSIIEGGEIVYDGQDLLKITEEDFTRIRGDKIAMIFQDPLSSLNPIMRIGKQLTEAMLLKGKLRQKESRRNFNGMLALLNKNMIAAIGQDSAAVLTDNCKKFNKFEFKHIELEKAYNTARDTAEEMVSDIDNALFLIEKNSFTDQVVFEIKDRAALTKNPYLVNQDAEKMDILIAELKREVSPAIHSGKYDKLIPVLEGIRKILQSALEQPEPNFFSMGYYLTFSGEELPKLPVPELNKYLRKYLDENFMLSFIKDTVSALRYSAEQSYKLKEKAIAALRAGLEFYSGRLEKKSSLQKARELTEIVNASIDHLEIIKDSIAYTFDSGIEAAVSLYFRDIEKNEAEKVRFTKQSEKYKKLLDSGKRLQWKVVPASYADMDLARENILNVIRRLLEHYETLLAQRDQRDYEKEAVAMVDYLKLNASGVVYKITKKMAKRRALKLMEEVGISEPRKRYRQYPFEFSGGMRQRIVIAIALAADPDILICDEPTTALDVTIQAQILELINDLKKKRNLSIIFITHDLGVVANMADRIAVMYAGKIVEYGTSVDIFSRPAHPYTWALLASMPDLETNEKLESIPGTPPDMIYPPKGDAFADRNKYAMKIDFERQPPMFEISPTHAAATWLLHPDAPKVEMPEIVRERIHRMLERESARRSAEQKNGGVTDVK